MPFLKLLSLFIGLLATTALALPQAVGENKTHFVQKGDSIFTVSRQYGLAPDHLLWANERRLETPLKLGEALLIPLRRIPPFTPSESTAVVLNLPERMLYLFRGGQMVKYWGVAIGGAQYPTPTGDFRILAKEKNPTWEPPKWLQRKAIGPGPENPLGDRWLQITPDMVGIHGTNNPDSIGGVASLGCVRLYPEAIRELYEQVGVGTPVYVIYEQVRVGREADGSLAWSFFPDPYGKYYSLYQARQGLAQASREGAHIEISDFEIRERAESPSGLLSPIFGLPIKVESQLELPALAALKKPTGNWLNLAVLEKMGLSVERSSKSTRIRSSQGKVARVSPQKIPLNPHRLPKQSLDEEISFEGHRWNDTLWLPFPIVLDFFEIPYEWDAKSSVLKLL